MPDSTTLGQLLSRWDQLRAEGKETEANALCEQHPELGERVKGVLAMDKALARVAVAPTGPQQATDRSGDAPAQPATVEIPGYEILAELGHGGMGVVYKARQERLGRTVALKMILSGARPGREQLVRFRTEAEAVARLQHPGIVQIHETGVHNGLPYFSLEFVPGGSLDRKLNGAPLPPKPAARLTDLLAQAVQAAHEKGVLHRDLKPANVLLMPAKDGGVPIDDGAGKVGHFLPKIADFGLAKKLELAGEPSGEPGALAAALTQTGAIMGTPSYMAPEQAAGTTRAIGPTTDVYALGAILYNMLTGRPPFRAATTRETLNQVIAVQPVSPRQLNPATPRDLETICLKCLGKEPAQRYGSAQELAEDLERFLKSEPILARPVGRIERTWRWCQRNPVVAGLTAAVALVLLLGAGVGTGLAWWALRERDRADNRAKEADERLDEVNRANRRRLDAQVDELGNAVPDQVRGLLARLAEDRETVRPRLRELWEDEAGGRLRRMRAGLALLDDDPSFKDPLAAWMLETDDPREMLLVRDVLARLGAELAIGLWDKADHKKQSTETSFRALVVLATFDAASARWQEEAPGTVAQLVKANPLFLGLLLEALRPVREQLQAPLLDVFHGKQLADRRVAAATVLADYLADEPRGLADLACDADAEQFDVLRPALKKMAAAVNLVLQAELAKQGTDGEKEVDRIARAKRQANAAAALVVLGGESEAAWRLLKHSRTPDARTFLIHGLAPRQVHPRALVRRLETEKDDTIRAALLLALGEYTAEEMPDEVASALKLKLLDWYHNDPDPGVHGAIDWLLRHDKEGPTPRPLDWQGGKQLDEIDAALSRKPGSSSHRWYVTTQGQTIVCVRGPVTLDIGSTPKIDPDYEIRQKRTIVRSFAIASKPVTVDQWQKFMDATRKLNLNVRHQNFSQSVAYFAPQLACPIILVNWYEAAMYCRWLSEQEEVPNEQMVYPPLEDILKCADGKTPLKLPKDHLSRIGYRLPTQTEWEYTCRADTTTRWYFGEAEELLPRHAWFFKNSTDRSWPVGQKMPNELGLFDMHGNVFNWCQDGDRNPDLKEGMEDIEDNREITARLSRALRGCSFANSAENARSANRIMMPAGNRTASFGFRVARTLSR